MPSLVSGLLLISIVLQCNLCFSDHIIQSRYPSDIAQEMNENTDENIFLFERKYKWKNPLVVTRDNVALRGLNVKLKLGKNEPGNLLVILGENVTVSSFKLTGTATRSYKRKRDGRASLLTVRGNGVELDDGVVDKSAGNGIVIMGDQLLDDYPATKSIDRCTISNISGSNNGRDLLSLESSVSDNGLELSGCRVSNISGRKQRGSLRGVVELSDGVHDIHVDGVTSFRGEYAVEIQDHGNENQINYNILVENVRAERSRYAVHMDLHASNGHRNFTLDGIASIRATAAECVVVRHATDVSLLGCEIEDNRDTDVFRIKVTGSSDVLISEATVNGASLNATTQLNIINSENVTINL